MPEPHWKQDFPIEWEKDKYITRREFTKFLVLTSLALFVGNVWIALRQWMGGWTQTHPPGVRIASRQEIPVGGVKLFRYPDEKHPCILIRPSEHEIVAYSQKCTHLACAVFYKPEDQKIHCPCHDGVFDSRTGHVLSGPPNRALPRIKLAFQGDQIWATGIAL